MARIRTIKPEFFSSESMSGTSVLARLLCIGLFTYCDDDGRGRADVRLIKGELFALDDVTGPEAIVAALGELREVGTICRYVVEVEGTERAFIHFPKWRHQKISHPTPSRFPACPVHDVLPNISGEHPEPSGARARARNREQGTGNREQGRSRAARFDEFWSLYPRKVGKEAARSAFATALKRVEFDELMAALRQQLPHFAVLEAKFVPHPRTWLSQGRWDDVPPEGKRAGRSLWDRVHEGSA